MKSRSCTCLAKWMVLVADYDSEIKIDHNWSHEVENGHGKCHKIDAVNICVIYLNLEIKSSDGFDEA